MSQFKVGTEVEWSSQANGSAVAKKGKVVAVAIAGQWPEAALGLSHFHEYEVTFDAPCQPRNHVSFLVAVEQSTLGHPRKPKLYWPRVSALRLVEGETK